MISIPYNTAQNMFKKLEFHSGGQTGADRAGLDAARFCGFKTGGWAAKDYMIQTWSGENISDCSLKIFGLKEYPEAGYPPRTKANVFDTDLTVWFGRQNSPGGRLTIRTAKNLERLLLINPSAEELADYICSNDAERVNIAGNRLSEKNPDIYLKTFKTLVESMQILNGAQGLLPSFV